MKKVFLYLLFVAPLAIQAQSLSIEELWSKLDQTYTIRQAAVTQRMTQQDLTIERLNRYPVVYGDANLQRNIIIPTTPVPAIAFDPSAQDGAILPLQFATKWNAKAGLQAEWNFFDPNRKTALKEKNILIDKSKIQQKQTFQNLKKEATLAYVSLVLASLQHQAATIDSAQFAQILQVVKNRYDAGRETSEQYLSAQQEFERKKIQWYETWSVLKQADLELQKYIDLDGTKQLSSDLEAIKKGLKHNSSINYEVDLIQMDQSLNENNQYALKRQVLPSLTFNAYYGAQFYSNEFNITKHTAWYGNSYMNIALRLPISTYWAQSTLQQKINLQREQNQLQLDESIKLDEIQKLQKSHKTSTAEQKINSLRKVITLSQENIKRQQANYEAGRILWSDYNRSLINHNANLKELWQAEFDLITIYLD